MKNTKLSSLDLNQMQIRTFDEDQDATRVVLVGQQFEIDSKLMANAFREGLKDVKINVEQSKTDVPKTLVETRIEKIEVPQIIREVQIERIEIPVVTTRIERVDVPIIIPRIEFVDRPVIVKEIEIVEKPVIIKEYQIKEIATRETTYLRAAVIAQALMLLFLLVKR